MFPTNMQHDDCFSNMVQDFLVCTTVHKARNLGIFNDTTVVSVTIDKATKSTKPFTNSENPVYNEYFVFQLTCTLNELLRKSIVYELRKFSCFQKSIAGELIIDLSTVWTQHDRYFFKRWGRFEDPLDKDTKKADTIRNGYLQIDLAIITDASNSDTLFHEIEARNAFELEYARDYDDIKHNMLTNVDPKAECNVRYTISFFDGYFVKKGDYYVQFLFHPFKGRTEVCKSTNTPTFNENVTFNWTYPSVTQNFVIQIFKGKCISEYELRFNEIAFKDKPKLGPTFLHFYDIANPTQYVGRLVVEIRSECLQDRVPPREIVMGRVLPNDEQRWWQDELFTIQFVAMSGDFLHGNFSSCKITMKVAEFTSNALDCATKPYVYNKREEKNLRYFRNVAPFQAINIAALLPDHRFKYDSDYFLQEIVDYMKSEIETFKLYQIKYHSQYQQHRKCLRYIINSVINKIKEGISRRRLEYSSFTDPTTWDTNRIIYLQAFMRSFPEQLRSISDTLMSANSASIEHTIDETIQELLNHYKNLMNLMIVTRLQDDWPELFLILSSGNKDIGMCRVNAKPFLNTPVGKSVSASNSCWCVRHFIFKDINCTHSCNNCGCVVGIVEGCLGIVAENEFRIFLDEIYEEWLQIENFQYQPSIPYTYFKCRIFIYQAKVRPGHDASGLCDAFARVLFNGLAAQTTVMPATLSPSWNMVISFDNIRLPGCVDWYQLYPPLVSIEMYDVDKHTADDYLGCGFLNTTVIRRDNSEISHCNGCLTAPYLRRFHQLGTLSPPIMRWVSISSNGMIRAEILASAELVQTSVFPDDEEETISDQAIITIGTPTSIRPIMKNYVIEVVFAGFRNYVKSFSGRHRVKIMMADLILYSGLTTSRMKNSINFLVLYASGVVNLPEQLEYWPTIIATDVVVSGTKESTIGAMILSNSKRYLQKNKVIMAADTDIEIESPFATVTFEEKDNSIKFNEIGTILRFIRSWLKPPELRRKCQPNVVDEKDYNWWTKFYNSIHKNSPNFNPCKHVLTVFEKELEKYADFSYMHDWAEPVMMVHGIKFKKNTIPKEEIYATLKLHVQITPCSTDFGVGREESTLRPLAAALNPEYQLQVASLGETCKIVARIYIVQGINFRPRDKNSPSDAYVRVRLGSKSINNRAHFLANQSNPIFGTVFELEGLLPRDHLLEVTVFDKNFLKDNVIGSTIIDLEDRWRTKHRASFGLANEYSRSGYNEWRDLMTPSELLCDYCRKANIRRPRFTGNRITVDGETFTDESRINYGWYNEDLQERLSLTALKNLHKLPMFGYKLVPEHVETRSLYRTNSPGIEQGKIQLWVELYEGNVSIPPPINITPLEPLDYELRVVVFNCQDITLDERNIFGTKMSDIFVKCWCNDFQKFQVTDTHFRSLNGKGKFNWRMIYRFKYSPIEDMMICKRKVGVLEEYVFKQPAILYVQVWDNDVISKDDFLAALEINLANFPNPYSHASDCNEISNELDSGWRSFGASTQSIGERIVRRKPINLFQEKRVKGWFPLRGPLKKVTQKDQYATSRYAGKIELALEIMPASEADIDPAGLGRNEPNALPPPHRPNTSFNPYLNPMKSCKHIIWPFARKWGFIFICVALIIMSIVFAVMNLPYIMMLLFLH